MLRNKITVVLDGQAGSCGKGKFVGYLANKDDIRLAMNNFMSNAGHTYVTDDGEAIMTQHLPTSIVNRDTRLVIGPGAAITPKILFDEIIKYREMIGQRKIIIHPRAAVIQDKHIIKEQQRIRSGSTFKGCGAAQADKIMRSDVILFGDYFNAIRDCLCPYEYTSEEALFINKHIHIMDTMEYVNNAYDGGHSIMIEGSQGTDLDINYGLKYPYTTSRQCHAGQLIADCGLSPMLFDRCHDDIIMIIRPYPIRISNTTNLNTGDGGALVTSSGDYNGSAEITWEQIRQRCGAPDNIEFGETTTVTKKTRRVFEMDWDRLIYTTKLNRPTQIALNFAQYIDWSVYECTNWHQLSEKVIEFMSRIERCTNVPVTLVGTGARNKHIIDLRGEYGLI